MINLDELISLAKSVEPQAGYFGYFDLVDALEAKPEALERFKKLISEMNWKQADLIYDYDKKYGWLIMGAADALDLLQDELRQVHSTRVTEKSARCHGFQRAMNYLLTFVGICTPLVLLTLISSGEADHPDSIRCYLVCLAIIGGASIIAKAIGAKSPKVEEQ